jgi:hypothetical protein
MGKNSGQNGNQQQKISNHEHLSLLNFGNRIPAWGMPSGNFPASRLRFSPPGPGKQCSSHSAVHTPPGQPQSFHHMNIVFHVAQSGRPCLTNHVQHSSVLSPVHNKAQAVILCERGSERFQFGGGEQKPAL